MQICDYSIQSWCLFCLYKWEFGDAQENNKKNVERRFRWKSCHHSVSNNLHLGLVSPSRLLQKRDGWGGVGGPSWSRVCKMMLNPETVSVRGGPAAGRFPSPPAPVPSRSSSSSSSSSSSQFTVGTWFKLYSLALSRRLAMLLAMFMPWDVLVLEQVGG